MTAIIDSNIEIAAALLRDGQCVAIPTETVYGLAANALDREAAGKIFKIKNRPEFDPLIIHVDSIQTALKYVEAFPEKAMKLARAFWPGPLTLILPKKKIIPFEVTSGLDTVGIRVPQHDLTLQLLENLKFPLAAPSANPFGYVSPTNAEHVIDQLGDKINYILDGGECHIGIESTIVGFEKDDVVIYRQGGLTQEMIEGVIGQVKVQTISSSNPKAPGMLTSHYSPLTKVILVKEPLTSILPNSGYIAYKNAPIGILPEKTFILSESENLFEAARRLYAGLRLLDAKKFNQIYVEMVPNEGLGVAINDRITRASS